MRYVIKLGDSLGIGAHQRDERADAVKLALEFMDGAPPLAASITDQSTGRVYYELDIRRLAAESPAPSKSVFGDHDA